MIFVVDDSISSYRIKKDIEKDTAKPWKCQQKYQH